jgi:hypothetical protein
MGGAVEERFTSLFSGTLADWRMAGAGRFNIVGDEVLESEGGPGLLWYTKEPFADFALCVDWRLSSIEDNSGVYVRFPPLGSDDPEHDWQVADHRGYEVQIDDRGYDPETKSYNNALHLTGAIYKLAPALRRMSHPVGAWNTFRIEARGDRLSVVLNGQLVSSFKGYGNRPLRGHIGLQTHHPGSRVQFRNICIREY